MSEPTDEKPLTLATRMEDEARSVTDRDLERVSGFLYETIGRWYELKPAGSPPSVEPSDIIITTRPATGLESAETALLDAGDDLDLALSDDDDGSDDDDARDEDGDEADERDGVFDASATLAQVAVGRVRADDESWEDVIQLLEADQRPALASALWVGLAAEPALRYRSVGQWRRSVDAALRSDAATATMFDEEERRSRTVPIVVAAILLAIAAGAYLLQRDDATEVEDAAVTTAPGDTTTEDADAVGSTSVTTTVSNDGSSPFDRVDGAGDPCALAGPLGPITIDQVSDTAIVVAWTPTTEAVDILLDGVIVDTVPAEAFRYVIEHQPLSDDPLIPDTDYLVAVEPRSGVPSTACTTTLANPVPGSEFLIGVTAPTGFEVVDTSPTSITVSWDARAGADLHNLFLDGAYVRFGDVGGSTAIGDETEFTFVDLEPETTYEIGIRRVEGPNESSLVTITASTDPR